MNISVSFTISSINQSQSVDSSIDLDLLPSQSNIMLTNDISSLQLITATLISLRTKVSLESKLLSYMASYSESGYYYAGKGSRELLTSRLKINKTAYQEGIKRLKRIGLIKQCRNGRGNQYHYYQILPNTLITEQLKHIKSLNGLVISITTSK